ncbi:MULTISPECIES: response regulator [Thiothrix]|jgi:signal transduction histidine kinase/DNA-binding response OmpR family regulator|uniref:response regulator n=1 Tax=Thiothrix TaxID=1030 RepID=UPI00257A0FEA|nr:MULTISPECIES: response regulator [Thiothrix]MDX9988339.1 response regulator [Thiothrix unzii]
MRFFTNLRLLQLIDSALLILLLGVIAVLLWFSLSDVSNKAQQNQQHATVSLQSAYDAFQQQIKLETQIDEQRDALNTLNDALFSFASNPNSDRSGLAHLQTLSQRLQEESEQLLQVWPSNADTELKAQFEEVTGIMTGLAYELESLSPGHWKQLAQDAQDTTRDAQELIEELETLDDAMAQQVTAAIQQSIASNTDNTAQMATRLETIKHRTLWFTAALILSLLVSRAYFSGTFKQLLETARNAQHVAEDAVKTKSRFLATMSHEIRTPMNGVIGMTRLLMNTPMSKKQSEFVESIHLSGEHLLTVINDVLDFSKMEAGKLDLKREPLELRACIEDVLNLLTSKALEKDLELAYAVGPSIPLFIEGDMVRLRQVLTNLLGNAIKFTDSGEITVFVMLRNQVDGEYELEFQINDTGPGIPAERLESIFEQFSRAEETLSHRHEGTGLGLAISRRLVEMMEGRIWAESTLGVGSHFHFTLKTRQAAGKLKPFLHPNIPEIVGKRILVVENNPASSQALSDFCSGWGAKVDSVKSVSDAIGWIAVGRTYDIALVDSNLPGDTPLEFAKYVRNRYDKQTLPLILIAPPNDRHPKDTVRELYNLYLTKPITRSRLFDSLMTVLGELNLLTIRPEITQNKLGERLPLRILLAEDNPINQIVATSILDEMAYKADVAENGREVIEMLRKKPYHVIFMDMQMPEMDGLEATRRIREEFPADRQPVIIAMTANAMDSGKQECLAAGMNDYISKPILPETVEAALQHWCSKTAIATGNHHATAHA